MDVKLAVQLDLSTKRKNSHMTNMIREVRRFTFSSAKVTFQVNIISDIINESSEKKKVLRLKIW